MLDRLPSYIDPLSFADRAKQISARVDLQDLSRLSEMLLENSGEVEVNLAFAKEGRLPVVVGELKTNLVLQCQSCLQRLEMTVDQSFKLGMVSSLEQADRLDSDCEPFLLQTEKVSLIELVEDELLLALPDFPRHTEECVQRENEDDVVEAVENEQARSDNPFSVLAKLKNTGD